MLALDGNPFFLRRAVVDHRFLLLEVSPAQAITTEGQGAFIGFFQPVIHRREGRIQAKALADQAMNFIVALGLTHRLYRLVLIEHAQDVTALHRDQVFMLEVGLRWQDQIGIRNVVFHPGMDT